MNKILIISTNAIGDTYLSMSAISSIKAKFPNVEIYFLVAQNSKFLFEYTEVKFVFTIHKQIWGLITLVRKLRKNEFDFIFSFFSGRVNSFFLKFSKAKNRGGFLNFRKINHWANKILIGTILKGGKKDYINWQPDENFLFLIKRILQKFDFPQSAVTKYVYDIGISGKYKHAVVFHPISKIKEKSLSKEQILSLVNFFNKNKEKVILLGDKKLNELFQNENIDAEFTIQPNIKQLIDLVHCKLFISVDSFPLHIADAYNTNFVGIFCNTLPEAVLTHHEKAIKFSTHDLSKICPEQILNKLKSFF